MKFKLKKAASVLLIAALGSVIMFSGCSGGEDDESSVYSKNEQSSTSSSVREESSKAEASQESSAASEGSKDESTGDPDYTPAMWKVTKDDKAMYLFGSIHATDDGAENLPDYVQNAFDECNYLAVELNSENILNNLSESYSLVMDMLYTDGTTIKDHISEETYNAVKEYLTEKNMYSTYYDSFKPIMWISLLEKAIYDEAGIDSTNSMESIMIAKAEEASKEVLEVESMATQLAVFDKISDELADYLLRSYIEDGAADKLKTSVEELYEAWKTGEALDGDDDTDAEEIPDNLMDDYEAYNKAMLTDRNVGMADKAEEYMNDGKKVFFMVGASHMYGDDGVVSLLQQRGYTVERVSPDTGAASSAEAASQPESKAA